MKKLGHFCHKKEHTIQNEETDNKLLHLSKIHAELLCFSIFNCLFSFQITMNVVLGHTVRNSPFVLTHLVVLNATVRMDIL
jgi:hypothetical protein